MEFEPDDLDLEDLAQRLHQKFGELPPVGYVPGRTVLRDAVMSQLGCSQLQAEEIVDTMVEQGFLRYQGPTVEAVDDLEPWRIITDSDLRGLGMN